MEKNRKDHRMSMMDYADAPVMDKNSAEPSAIDGVVGMMIICWIICSLVCFFLIPKPLPFFSSVFYSAIFTVIVFALPVLFLVSVHQTPKKEKEVQAQLFENRESYVENGVKYRTNGSSVVVSVKYRYGDSDQTTGYFTFHRDPVTGILFVAGTQYSTSQINYGHYSKHIMYPMISLAHFYKTALSLSMEIDQIDQDVLKSCRFMDVQPSVELILASQRDEPITDAEWAELI
jgi:hypothetical protein